MAYFSMSLLALKWALKKPVTSRYPFESRQLLPGSRGTLSFNHETCAWCTVCAKKCPTGALLVNRAKKVWSIDRLRCIACGNCIEACPKKCLRLEPNHMAPAVTKDREFYGTASARNAITFT